MNTPTGAGPGGARGLVHRAGAVGAALVLLLGQGIGAGAAPARQPVIFGDGLVPPPDSIVAAGAVGVGCTVNSALPLASYQLYVDDVAAPTIISGDGPPWQLRATVPLSAGPHQASVNVTDTAGQAGGWTWRFIVEGAAPATGIPVPGTPTPGAPTPTPAPLSPTVQPLTPAPGWVVPAGPLHLSVDFGTDTGFASQTVTLDGTTLKLITEGAGAGHTVLGATVPVGVGAHKATALGVDTLGREARMEWTFLAAAPVPDSGLRIIPLAPLPGQTVNGGIVRLAARLESPANLQASTLLFDGKEMNTEGGGADPHHETIFLEATGVAPGLHTVRVQAGDDAGKTITAAWDFYVGTPDGNDRVLYPQTGYSVAGPFKRYWDTLGASALQVLGYPISGLLVEKLGDGHEYTVQYYERVRLEWHPENAGNEFEVLYGLLGTQFHKPDPSIKQPTPRAGEQFFPETGHLVRGPFLRKWQATGGLRVHGFPISEEIQEVSPTDRRVYLVQYFQRARFEFHPENTGTPFDILLGMLGRQLYSQQYPDR